MKTGDNVSVHGRAGDVDDATILDIRPIEDLPDVVPLIDVRIVRALLIGDNFRRAAVIAYNFLDNGETVRVMFVALEDGRGSWWDLRGHNLQINEKGDNDKCPAPSTASTPPSQPIH
jgi:hypothetical protein